MSVKARSWSFGLVGVVLGMFLASGWLGIAALVLLVAVGAQWAGGLWNLAWLVLLVLLVLWAVPRFGRQVARAVMGWVHPRVAELEVVAEDRPFAGSTYTFWDSYGTRRYDGRSGDLKALTARIEAHLDPEGETALSGKVGPGWTWQVRTYPTYEQAKVEEARLIALHFGKPGYENRRMESAA